MVTKSDAPALNQPPHYPTNKISVCMATHNGSAYVSEQIASILKQLAETDELIISDDVSTDDTVTLIEQIQDSRIRFLGSARFGSPVLNFECALQHATGDYIFLADQDDVWVPDKVSVTLPLLQQHDVVLSDCQLINQHGNLIQPSFFALRNSRPGFWNNLYKNAYMGCCMAFRREVLTYALPFPAHIHMHDWWIGLMVEMRGRVIFVNEPLVLYRRHDTNASPTGKTTYSVWQQLRNRLWMGWSIGKRLMTGL